MVGSAFDQVIGEQELPGDLGRVEPVDRRSRVERLDRLEREERVDGVEQVDRFGVEGLEHFVPQQWDDVLEPEQVEGVVEQDRKSTRLNSSHVKISYAVFCLKKKKII